MADRSPFPTSAGSAPGRAPAQAPAAGAPAVTTAESDPMPGPPVEPQLEDCCGSGCVVCVFDAYEMARERYAARLQAARDDRQCHQGVPGGAQAPPRQGFAVKRSRALAQGETLLPLGFKTDNQ